MSSSTSGMHNLLSVKPQKNNIQRDTARISSMGTLIFSVREEDASDLLSTSFEGVDWVLPTLWLDRTEEAADFLLFDRFEEAEY